MQPQMKFKDKRKKTEEKNKLGEEQSVLLHKMYYRCMMKHSSLLREKAEIKNTIVVAKGKKE